MTSSVASGRNVSLRQRDRMVGNSRAGAWLTSRKSERRGGSSQNLEQRIGGIRIELVDGIDDADPPALDCRGRAEKRDRLPGLVDGDHRPHHALLVERAFQDEQAAMGTGRDQPRSRLRRINRQCRGALHCSGEADRDGRARTLPCDRRASPCRCPARRRSARRAPSDRCDSRRAAPARRRGVRTARCFRGDAAAAIGGST